MQIKLTETQKAIVNVAAHIIVPVAVVVGAKLIEKKMADKTAE
jgi:hypothetical protein